ncbi:MAG: hypothetical protein DRN95_05860 [Candidatus Hydrothermarchaeota archaeon]|nr:MAG: hypothetical protein DRN95_05860 [Candidatus Hydrothermarchaeota archaeon]
MGSLREWAREKRVWKLDAWKSFLQDNLVPFYSLAYDLNRFNNLLQGLNGKALIDIDEELREKIRVCLYGGIGPGQDVDRSFARFMFDYFGMCTQGASTLDESTQSYEFGDEVKISFKQDSRIASIQIRDLWLKVGNIIEQLSKELGVTFEAMGLLKSPNSVLPQPVGSIDDPSTLLPQPGEEPERLLSLVNDFRQRAVNLSIGVNPFMTFMFYVRAIPIRVLREFLGCDPDELTELINFLGLKPYSMMDGSEIKEQTKSELVILLAEGNSLISKFLELNFFLVKIEQKVGEILERTVQEASRQIRVDFEPWEKFKPFFVAVKGYVDQQQPTFYVKNEGPKITEVNSAYTSSTPLDLLLPDFLMKLSPWICSGMIGITHFSSYYINFKFNFPSLAKEWIEGVIQNEGKA